MKIFISLFLGILLTTSSYSSAESLVGGVNHIGLAVTKLQDSRDFFVDQLGFREGGYDEDYPAFFLGNGKVGITLWQIPDPENAVAFDRRKNVGLHHLALNVASFEELDALHLKLQGLDNVKIEFAPELLGNGPSKHMMIYEPSGNRIEFIHRPAK